MVAFIGMGLLVGGGTFLGTTWRRELGRRLRRCPDVTGRSREELLAYLGPPTRRTRSPGQESLTWAIRGHTLTVVFQDGVCVNFQETTTAR